MKKLNLNLKQGISIKLTQVETDKVKTLKEKHCINISAVLRQAINEMYEKYEKMGK